ncbi:MAG: MucR family transcriptional regulator [Magnetococcales bacterium]|nr:MucR family transcriptional regulator [Magnetococcales bacterium]
MPGLGIITMLLVMGYIVTRMIQEKQEGAQPPPRPAPSPPRALPPAPTLPAAAPPPSPTAVHADAPAPVPTVKPSAPVDASRPGPAPASPMAPSPSPAALRSVPAQPPAAAQPPPEVTADGIVCLACGQRFKGLRAHITRAHKITVEAYRDRFGLDANTPMALPTTPAKAGSAQSGTATPTPDPSKPAPTQPTTAKQAVRARRPPKTT